jgi:hypothetical protein
MGRTCSTHWEYEKCIQNFVGKPEGKVSFGKTQEYMGNNIRMYLKVNRLGGCGLD